MPNWTDKLLGLFGRPKPTGDPDASVRAALLEHGDDGRAPRDAIFYFYGGDFDGLAKAASEAGYAARPTVDSDGVILSKTMPVDETTFRSVAYQMATWAEEFDCEYDGWEAELLAKSN